jgi:type IV pilus assembly protein PilE
MTARTKTGRAVACGAARGFTMLEIMLVVAIIGTLAAIAVPSYADYVRRSRILDAVARLADARARMEEYFLDQRSYVDAGGRCGVPPPTGTAGDAFALACEASANAYTYTATGLPAKGMAAFTYSIDQAGAKTTVSLPAGWSRGTDCWTIRADGLCV